MLSTAVLLAASITLGQGAEATPMPADVRKQLDENVIGEWTLKATHGEATITGEETWTWSSDNVCLVFRGSLVVDGKKATYGGVMGWDGTERALVSHMFTSDGDIGMTRWKQLGPSQWNGTWSGTYQGQRTETPAKIEFKKEFTRYEDTTNGKPWVSIATRKAKKTPPSNYEQIKDFEYFIGAWEAKADDGGVTWWTFGWTVDKNLIENHIIGTGPKGDGIVSNRGMLGWDANDHRITNWCFNERGDPLKFFWSKRADSTWDSWAPGMRESWRITILDKDTWSLVLGSSKQVFKRKTGG